MTCARSVRHPLSRARADRLIAGADYDATSTILDVLSTSTAHGATSGLTAAVPDRAAAPDADIRSPRRTRRLAPRAKEYCPARGDRRDGVSVVPSARRGTRALRGKLISEEIFMFLLRCPVTET